MSKDSILYKFQLLWNKYPDMRVGQLVENICGRNIYIWAIPDNEFEKRLDILLEKGFKCLRADTEAMLQENLQ